VWDFLAVFPDQKEYMLYDAPGVPFFLSPGRVANRTEKNQVGARVRARVRVRARGRVRVSP